MNKREFENTPADPWQTQGYVEQTCYLCDKKAKNMNTVKGIDLCNVCLKSYLSGR